jgi:hypothetical protein
LGVRLPGREAGCWVHGHRKRQTRWTHATDDAGSWDQPTEPAILDGAGSDRQGAALHILAMPNHASCSPPDYLRSSKLRCTAPGFLYRARSIMACCHLALLRLLRFFALVRMVFLLVVVKVIHHSAPAARPVCCFPRETGSDWDQSRHDWDAPRRLTFVPSSCPLIYSSLMFFWPRYWPCISLITLIRSSRRSAGLSNNA